MTRSESYRLALGRATASVERGWTKGAYSRHPDGRALQAFGVRAKLVDIVGALFHASLELEMSNLAFEDLRYLVTAHLPRPYFFDSNFGIERFNDAENTTLVDVLSVLAATQEDYEWQGVVPSGFVYATIAA